MTVISDKIDLKCEEGMGLGGRSWLFGFGNMM